MDEPSEAAQNDDPSTQGPLPEIITIAPQGDILLEVTFETSIATLKATRKATPKPRPGQRDPLPPPPILRPEIKLAYRVDQSTLKQQSRYFTNLLGDTRFQEARAITARHGELTRAGLAPSAAPADQLPRVRITDDDEATRSAGRDAIFGDMLRLLHGALDTTPTRTVTMIYVTTLAVMADRFACTAAVGRHLTTRLKFRWPPTPAPRLREDGTLSSLSAAAEQLVRQKVLVSWLLEWPIRFAAATREMVWYGSTRWSEQYAEEEYEDEGPEADAGAAQEAVWWYLADGLEEELHTRRTALLATLASIPTHFLHLYTHRTRNGLRQCALGYDSSAACDSFQLGEMVKFLVSKSLLSLTTFAPSTATAATPLASHVDFAAVDLHSILAALKKCPTYQIDRNHTNCGLRTRIGPVVEYVTRMLSAGSVQINLAGWKAERRATSWAKSTPPASAAGEFVVPTIGGEDGATKASKGARIFRFTRAVANDQRLRYEGAMAADKMARELFTADGWDWTPEDVDRVDRDAEGWRLSTSMPLRRK